MEKLLLWMSLVWGPFMILPWWICICLPTSISSFVVQPHSPAQTASIRWQQQQRLASTISSTSSSAANQAFDLGENDRLSSWSLQRLLKELDDRGIRYPVTASRTDLEQLFLQWKASVPQTTKNSENNSKHQFPSSSPTSTTLDPGLEERLRKRRNRRRRYHRSEMIADTPISSQNEFPRRPSTTVAATSWARKTVTERIPRTARNVVDRGWRITKKVSRKARDWMAIDEDGVRDVSFQYLDQRKNQTKVPSASSPTTSSKAVDEDDNIPTVHVVEVITTKSDKEIGQNGVRQYDMPLSKQSRRYVVRNVANKTRQPRPRQRVVRTHRPVHHSTTSPTIRPQTRASASPFAKQRTTTGEPKRRKTDYATTSSSSSSSSSSTSKTRHSNFVNPTKSSRGLPMLPPATDSTTPKNKYYSGSSYSIPKRPRSSRRNQSHSSTTTSTPEKRIYSPYGGSTRNDDRDVVDRVGEFLADTADRLMWGKFDTDRNNIQSDKTATQRTPSQKPDRSKTTQTSKQKQYRHWKDRLEERLDSMLGIHENGAFYNKWTQRYAQEKQEEEGTDAFAVARGRQRKKNHREKFDAKPFWEEDGSLMSLLFGVGHKNNGKDIFSDHRLDLESGSVLTLLRVVFRFSVMVASYLCRWASTGGAIPQPVVVVGVAAVGIVTRPRRRLAMMAITLLLMRVAGEAVHGYEQKGWEDFDPEYNEDESNSHSKPRKDGDYDDK